MNERWLMTAGLLLALALPAESVIPVEEIGPNLLQGTITAGQSTLTAIATAKTVANQILDLTPVDEVVILADMKHTMTELADIMRQVEGLSYDLSSLEGQLTRLFDLETAPASTSALKMRLAEIRRMRAQSYAYAMRLQTLMTTAVRTIDHLEKLVNSVRAFLGAKQGVQTLAQVNMTISKTLALQTARTAAYERAGSVDKMEELLTIESLHKINEAVMADWPRRK